jgi:peptidyl-prolyl cis-trans isomerase B (cyclophilin B)
MKKLLLSLLCLGLLPAFVSAEDQAQAASPTAQAEAKAEAPAKPKKAKKAKPKAAGKVAVIKMAKGGVIKLKFYPAEAPKTVENFIKLSRKGFYNGLNFHRVEPGFVVQGGDPNGNGSGGPGYTIKGEFSNTLKHVEGTVAMARTPDPDSAGSQFYICLGAAPFLDGKYAIFGQVTEGMDVVKGIQVGDKMETVTIE